MTKLLCRHSWEGYCIEQILAQLPPGVTCSHYPTQAGAEVDLVLEFPSGGVHAIQIKRSLSPKLAPAFIESIKALGVPRGTYLISEGEPYPLSGSVTAVKLGRYLKTLGNPEPPIHPDP